MAPDAESEYDWQLPAWHQRLTTHTDRVCGRSCRSNAYIQSFYVAHADLCVVNAVRSFCTAAYVERPRPQSLL